MKKMKYITITQKDIDTAKICNSPSGELIDELAYSAGLYTSNDIWENGFEYETSEPYQFDYESDLFENTKTFGQLNEMFQACEMMTTVSSNTTKLQAGAYCAIEYPETWSILLEKYKELLIGERVDSVSKEFNKQLQQELDDYYDQNYKEFLFGDRSNDGVVNLISRYYVESREGEYDQKNETYTFLLNDQDVEDAKNAGYKKNQLKAWLIDIIAERGDTRKGKDRIEREKRMVEYKRVSDYKKKMEEEKNKDRIEKIKAMIAE